MRVWATDEVVLGVVDRHDDVSVWFARNARCLGGVPRRVALGGRRPALVPRRRISTRLRRARWSWQWRCRAIGIETRHARVWLCRAASWSLGLPRPRAQHARLAGYQLARVEGEELETVTDARRCTVGARLEHESCRTRLLSRAHCEERRCRFCRSRSSTTPESFDARNLRS